MDDLLSDPKRLLALLCIVGLVLGLNAPLFFSGGLGKMFEREAKVWGKALQGGADVRKRREAELAELHDRVRKLKAEAEEENSKSQNPKSQI